MANSADERRAFAERVLRALDQGSPSNGWPIVPYPGVRSFTSDEETIFFGRDEDVNNIREKLSREGCVFVLGGSGSGKSSLVRAGLIPRIISGSPLNDRRGPWYVMRFTPGTDPFGSLARALVSEIYGISNWPVQATSQGHARRRLEAAKKSLARIFKRAGGEQEIETLASKQIIEARLTHFLSRRYRNSGEEVGDFMYSEVDRFHSDYARTEAPRTTNLIIIVDQFEEVFRDGVNPNGAQAIIRMMARPGSPKLPGFYTVATMRSEEVHRSVDYPDLTGLIDRTAHLVDLPDSNETFKAITSSARIVLQLAGFNEEADGGIEVAAAERLLDAVESLSVQRAQRADQLPLLQNALRELWCQAAKRWQKDPTLPFVINMTDVSSLPLIGDSGGVPDLAACLNRVADAAFDEAIKTFPRTVGEQAKKDLLEVAFVRLEQPDDRGNAARAFATVEDMLAAYGESWPTAADLQQALDVFVKRTMLQRLGDSESAVFDVSHEAVIRNWTKYARWVDDAGSIRRIISRFLEDVWDKQLPAGSPTQFEQNQWTPALSLRQCCELIGPNQAYILRSVRLPAGRFLLSQVRYLVTRVIGTAVLELKASSIPDSKRASRKSGRDDLAQISQSEHRTLYSCVRSALSSFDVMGQVVGRLFRFANVNPGETQLIHARGWPKVGRVSQKFGPDWLIAAITPAFEKRWRKRKQFSSNGGDINIKDEANKIQKWLISTIDRARFGQWLRSLRMAGGLVILAVSCVLALSLFRLSAALLEVSHQSLLGAARGDPATQWHPTVRAGAILYAAPEDKTNLMRLSDRIASFIVYLFNENASSLFKEKSFIATSGEEVPQEPNAFDAAVRETLGREFITVPADKFQGKKIESCGVNNGDDLASSPYIYVGAEDLLENETSEQKQPPIKRQPAFRIRGNLVKLAVNYIYPDGGRPNGNSKLELVESDLDTYKQLSHGARICLSSDGTVLTVSSPGQPNPDLLALQWTRCVPPESGCLDDSKRHWRVRYVPIDYDQGPVAATLPKDTFPRVNFIGYESKKVVVHFTATARDGSDVQDYRAEFFTELAIPKRIIIPTAEQNKMGKCHEDKKRHMTLCDPKGDGSVVIRVRRRGEEEPEQKEASVLRVDTTDAYLSLFVASKTTVPARQIDLAGITESGEVVLYEKATNVGWRFAARKSLLEDLLFERGQCTQQQDKGALQKAAKLAGVPIDSICPERPRSR
jgi:hypothetical protein